MIEGMRALEMLAENRSNEVVITTMSTARAWPAISTRPDLDYPLRGCMGKASSIGLGIVLARPDVRVVVLDGDGSLLMNLGTLVTVASQAPKNLVHVVFDGATYDTSGAQPTPGKDVLNWAALATAAGYKTAANIESADDLAKQWPSLLTADGPVFVRISVDSLWVPRRVPSAKVNSWQEMQANLAAV
jgi:thiamine pyrophosphate-dependent acetolactate synthase large subunit-like protein